MELAVGLRDTGASRGFHGQGRPSHRQPHRAIFERRHDILQPRTEDHVHSVPVPARAAVGVLRINDDDRHTAIDGSVRERGLAGCDAEFSDEVARELENPFRNAPNDVPLCTLLAFYNEALITTFAGFHPDAYWDRADVLRRKGRGGGGKAKNAGIDDKDANDGGVTPLLPDLLPEARISNSGEEKKVAAAISMARPHTAIPQSTVDNVDSLKELREMIAGQASEIKKLQDQVQRKGRPSSAPPC